MKKIRVLHIAEIDNDLTKGTSTIIPQYVIEQNKNKNLEVFFLNCNNLKLNIFVKNNNIFNLDCNYDNSVIKKVNPDIVIFHELYKPPYLKVYKYLIKNGIPYIIIPHGGMTKKAQNTKLIKKIAANFLLFSHFFKNAEMIQYLSEKEKENTKFRNLKYYILGNGINDIPTNNMYLNNQKQFDNNKVNFVYVGRYDYFIKGLDQLIEAFLLAKKEKLNVFLNLYGKGDNKTVKVISEYIKNNDLDEYIKLNGPVFGSEKKDILINNNVFIQVSRTEGQPLGVMEAMSLGMPVLLSYGTGYKDIVEKIDNGYIANTDAKNIYESIIKLYNEREKLKSKSIKSYSYARENFSWDNIVKQTVEEYMKIINS